MTAMLYRRAAVARFFGALVGICISLGLAYGAESPAGDGLPIRRYGMFIGSNNGGPDRVTLLYAASDCRAMLRVMEEVGGLAAKDTVLLVDPEATEVRRQLSEMGSRILRERPQARRVEFLLYYSGHSDEEALMLGQSRLGYAELRDTVRDLGADISIAILDSCASGAFIRMKGGQRTPAFLVDESSAIQGEVYLTSSSEDEASQESDTLGGSFFTHSLVSALRGAADFSLDGKVTLHEAYQYASDETLARTENTQGGAQHPSWYTKLYGSGDLVLTDLRSTSAGLTMSEELSGKIYIRDERGALVAEVRKFAGTPLALALPPGTYSVSSLTGERLQEATVALKDSKWGSLGPGDFRDAPRVATRTRGDEPGAGSGGESWTTTDEERARQLVQSVDAKNIGELLGELGKQIGKQIQERVQDRLDRVLKPGTGESAAAQDSTADETDWTRAEQPAAERGAGETVALVPFSIGFVPGLSFPSSSGARKLVSLNAIIGTSYSIAGFEASGIMSITSHDVLGGQTSGIGNIVSGGLTGLQAAGIFNIVEGRAVGVQSAGIFNIAKQGAGLVQAAGILNMVESGVSGAQFAGIFNRAPGLAGVQSAGIFNMADGETRGLQLAGLFNYATSLSGGQVAFANAAEEMRGAQVGVVNVTGGSARGVQVGLVNAADSFSGLPIGLVNLYGDGLMLASLAWDDRGFTTLEFASGTGLYTVLAIGAELTEAGIPLAVSGLVGMGVHLPLGPFYAEVELSARNAFGLPSAGSFVPTDTIPFPSARARAGILLFGGVGGFVGYAVDADLQLPGLPANTMAHNGKVIPLTLAGWSTSLYPRFYGGISVGRQPKRG